jgi:hypothetical protein
MEDHYCLSGFTSLTPAAGNFFMFVALGSDAGGLILRSDISECAARGRLIARRLDFE